MYIRVHVWTLYVCLYVNVTVCRFTSFYICEPDFICGWEMLKSIKRRVSGIGKDL